MGYQHKTQFEKHKMNVKLAAQTLSCSIADVIEFLDASMKLHEFQGSQSTITSTRTIDQLFNILKSRNPVGKGYKQPFKTRIKRNMGSNANYLLS